MRAKKRRWLSLIGLSTSVALVAVPGVSAMAADSFPEIQAGSVQYVSDVAWQYVKTGYGTYQRDFRNLGNSDKTQYKMKVAGQTFDKGVGLHVTTETATMTAKDYTQVKLSTNGLCRQFTSYVGVDDSGTGSNASAYANFVVTGDYGDGAGEQTLTSAAKNKGEVATLLDVDITGVQTLTIYARMKVGGNNGASFADLGEAKLNCTAAPQANPVRVFVADGTNLTTLAPGQAVTLNVFDAKPNTDITVNINGQQVTSVKAKDEGQTPVVFTVPVDITDPNITIDVNATDTLDQPSTTTLNGTVIIPTTGKFHVDCQAPTNGDGSEESPLNSIAAVNALGKLGAGSQILFKAGTSCDGMLDLTGDGNAEHRNILSSYGAGERPIINGQGAQAAVRLTDTSYWTIDGLHVKNPGTLGVVRQGILVESVSSAPKNSIVITNNLVEEVAGWGNKASNSTAFTRSAGIEVLADHEKYTPAPGLTDGITITNNEVRNTGGGGIKLQGDGQLAAGKYHQHVYIGHNDISKVGGDAIVVHASDSPIVEYNTAIDLGQGTYPFTGGNFAGIWGITSKDVLIRYNVVGNSVASTYDSTAWDCDWGMAPGTCTFEYNYSYNNAGGSYLDCISGCGNATTQTKAIVRYNIFQDDCRFGGASGGPAATWIYNNVFYCPTRTFVDDMSGPRMFFNNIVVSADGKWDVATNSYNERQYFNNAYYGGIQPSSFETNAIVGKDPGLVAPGSSNETFAFDGYKLLASSPLIGAGVDGDQFSGADIFGNTVTASRNIGAYEGADVAARPLAWDEARNTTSISHANNLRTGGVQFTDQYAVAQGQGRLSYLASALESTGLVSGQQVTVNDYSFTWDPTLNGTPDSVKATGQQIALGKAGSTLNYVGFSTGTSKGGAATITYADGTTQQFTMELPNWLTDSSDATKVATTTAYTNHNRSYLGSVSTVNTPSYVYASSVALENKVSPVVSVTLPQGSAVIGQGLTLFSLGVSGEAQPENPAAPVAGKGNVFFQRTIAQTVATAAMKVASADEVIAGDWDGDGVDTLALRHGTKYTFLATNRTGAADTVVDLGAGQPVVGDFNGDGKDDIALRATNSNLFSITYNVNGTIPAGVIDAKVYFGRAEDVPIAGDWDGDGKATVGIQRGNKFMLTNSLSSGLADVSFTYGRAGDVPIVGDYDGDGKDSIALARGPQVYVKNTLSNGDADTNVTFGRATDKLVAGDWFGTGTDTLAAARN